VVHPIERLRYVARASGADQVLLVRETAFALAAFHDDPAGLVAACRRIVDRHPTSAPLWWLCARVLTAPDGHREAWAATEEIEADPTPGELAFVLPEDATVTVVGWPEVIGEALPRRGDVAVLALDALGEAPGLVRRLSQVGVDAVDVPAAGTAGAVACSDVLLLEAVALGPSSAVVVSGSVAAAAVAQHLEVPVWLVAGVGRRLPARMWEALSGRLLTDPTDPWDRDEEILPLDLVDRVCGREGLVPVADAEKGVDCPVAPELFGGGRAPGTYQAGD